MDKVSEEEKSGTYRMACNDCENVCIGITRNLVIREKVKSEILALNMWKKQQLQHTIGNKVKQGSSLLKELKCPTKLTV